MTGGMHYTNVCKFCNFQLTFAQLPVAHYTPSHTNVCKFCNLQFSTYIFSAISPEMLKLGRVTNVKMLFLVLAFVFNFSLF